MSIKIQRVCRHLLLNKCGEWFGSGRGLSQSTFIISAVETDRAPIQNPSPPYSLAEYD